jgi:hypothetical protein
MSEGKKCKVNSTSTRDRAICRFDDDDDDDDDDDATISTLNIIIEFRWLVNLGKSLKLPHHRLLVSSISNSNIHTYTNSSSS